MKRGMRMHRQRAPRRLRAQPWLLVLGLMGVLLALLFLLWPRYSYQTQTPMGYGDLRIHGRAAPEGELLPGEKGPRNWALGMPLEEAIVALPVADDERQAVNYTVLYAEDFTPEETPLPPYAVLVVDGGRMEMRVVTAPSTEGLYGLVTCEIDPESGEITALRWRTVHSAEGFLEGL